MNSRASKTAASQFGAVSRRQLVGAGVSSSTIDRMRNRGDLIPLLPGVYRVSAAPQTWETWAWAALLWGGPSSALSHRSAARLQLGLDTDEIDITIPVRKRAPFGITVHYRPLSSRDTVMIGPFRVTRVAYTLLSIGEVVHPKVVDDLVERALCRHLVSIKHLQAVRDEAGRGVPGCAALRQAIAPRELDPEKLESWLERRLHRIIKSSPLPKPVCQVRTRPGDNNYRIDLSYPQWRIALEADGHEFHLNKQRRESDMVRENELVTNDWMVLRFSYAEITQNPERVIATIAAAIEARSRRENARSRRENHRMRGN